jgi:hypothetical protein
MEPIFPGMDPYLEQPSLWPDVHAGIIAGMRDQLQRQIVPRYIAQITPYTTYETIEIAPLRRAVIPDVGIYERGPADLGGVIATVDAPPLRGAAAMRIPTRYGRIEIRTRTDGSLVTAIELLSPANKRPGLEGVDAYEKKRQEFFTSDAHLLEIDLLRAGRRPQIVRPNPLPAAPYFIVLSRAEQRPDLDIWPCALDAPLPNVPVPLRAPDPDAVLALTPLIQQIYRSARYDLQVDYRTDPPPPDLSATESAWLEAQLRERGLRE